MSREDPHVAHLQRFPVKALDRQTPDSVALGAGGSVVGDRAWAIVEGPADEPHDPDEAPMSAYVNGKKTDAVHRLRAAVDLDAERITVRAGDGDPREFSLAEPAALNDWLSEYFGRQVSVRRGDEIGFPDRRRTPGPTVVATATLRTVAGWFDLDLEAVRRRFRANVEVGGVEPFWEDRLVADGEAVVGVRMGEALLEGVALCGRCVVPARDADTGERLPAFRERFSERREAALPAWAPESEFDHAYKLAATTRGADAEGATLSVGDPVEVLGARPA